MAAIPAGAAMTKQGNGATAEPPPAPEPTSASPVDALDLKGRLDRYGEILVKGLDLAEAGLSLGLMVIGRVGTAAQEKIVERFMDQVMPTPNAAASSAPPSPGPSPQAPPQAAPEAPAYGITNRLPLVPGAPFSVSFSINNDSSEGAKRVGLGVEPFTGERSGAALPANTLAVLPSAADIAPMDFEKFVLQGVIPLEMPPDIYHGAVSVGPESGIRIPVRLVVERGGAA